MSTTIDSKVVEMRFDNKQFESGVSTTMSTIDKLKQKLNFSGASKGLQEINTAAGKVDMKGLGAAVETVGVKFSALQVAGVTALANITNSAVNMGKKMVAALTIDPIKMGFQEYETQINSVQTILANTQKEGTNVEIVNKALDELNAYADKTIYNFTEMTRNIGTFTAAGVKLQTSVDAIQGIANLAAVSGSTSQQASTAMYQLSQALATGTVKLMDWNSVVNAGMGGQVFQDALKETSRLLQTGADAAIEKTGSFRESLKEGWLTAEVLTETLKKFTTSGAAEYLAEFTGLSQETIDSTLKATDAWGDEADAIDKAAEAIANKSGKNKEEIKQALQMAKNAEEAATKVKTFTQLWDVMKEAAQSGWSKTWRIIIGDFEEAKSLLTPLADFFTGFINKMSDIRNNLLESALGRGFTELSDKIQTILGPLNTASDAIGKVVGGLLDYDKLVDEIIAGKWGNQPTRWNDLTEAGYDWAHAQNLVNERLGDSTRHATNYKEAVGEATASTEKAAGATIKLTDEQKHQLIELAKLSDAQLRAKGYTEEQIQALRELQALAKKLGIPFEEFIEKLDEINGRWLLINSFKNIGQAIIKPLKAIADAWKEIFKPLSGDGLFNAITIFHKLTSLLVISDDAAERLKNTFKGIFSIFKMVGTLIGGGFKIAFTFLRELFSGLNIDLSGLGSTLGDGLQKFSKWVTETKDLKGAIDRVIAKIPNAVKKIKDWFAAFKQNPAVEKFIAAMKKVADVIKQICSLDTKGLSVKELLPILGENIKSAFKSLPGTMKEIGKNIIAGLKNGLSSGAVSGIFSKMLEIGQKIITTIKEILGIHSPSTVMYEVGTNVIQGLGNGIRDGVGKIGSIVKDFGSKAIEFFQNIDWGKIFAGSMLTAMVLFTKRIGDALGGLANALDGFGDVCDGVEKALKGFGSMMKGIGFEHRAKGILKLAIAIAVIAAAVALLSFIDVDDLIKGAVVIGAIAGILLIMSLALDKMSSATASVGKDGLNINGVKQGLIAIGTTVLLLAMAVKMIGKLSPEEAKQGFIGLAAMVGAMIIVLKAYQKLVTGDAVKNIDKLGKMMVKLSVSLLLMALVCKLVGRLSPKEMIKGAIFVAGFVVFIKALMAVTKGSGFRHIDKLGKMVVKVVFAMGLMVLVCKLASKLSVGEMIKGAVFAAGFVIFIKYLVKVTKVGKEQQLAKLGGLLLAVSTSLLMMVGVCKLVGMLTLGEMIKGAIFVAGFVVLVKTLVGILKIGNEQKMARVTGTILALSVSIAILAGVCVILGMLSLGHLAKGVAAVTVLGIIMKGLIIACKGAKDIKGTMMWMALAIGIMAASVIALSFVEPGKLAGATAALGILMGMFALMTKSLKGVQKATLTVILMAAVVAGLTAVLYLLSGLDTKSVVGSATALAELLLAVSAAMWILSKMHIKLGEALKGVLALTAMAIPMLAFVGILALMSKVENATKNAMALTVLMTAMSVMLGVLTVIGVFAGLALTGVIALTAMAIPMLAFVGVLALMNKVENATANAKALIALMTTMTDLLVKVAVVGPMALMGVAALTHLALLMGTMGVVATAVGALMEKFPSLEKFLDTGLGVMNKLATGVGEMIGNFVSALGSMVGDALIQFGKDLAVFMDTLAVASEKAAVIKSDSFDGVKDLIGVVGDIAKTAVGTTFADIFSFGESSMDKFKTDGIAFFEAMSEISKASEGVTVNEEGMNAVIKMATKMATLQGKLDAIGGVMSWFKGRTDLATFGNNIGQFINSMKFAMSNLTGITVNEEAMNALISAATQLAKLQGKLDPIGGVISWFQGRDDLATFGYNVGEFITSMKTAVSNLDGIVVNEEAMNALISAATQLAKLQGKLDPIGGVIAWFEGRDDLATFGENVGLFITSMKTAMSTLSDVTLNEEALASIISASKKLAELQGTLEPMGGVVDWFTGRDDLGTFGDNIKLFAEGMAKLKEGMGEDGISAAIVDSVTNAGNAIIALNNTLPEEGFFDGKMNLTEFSEYIIDFATAMSEFGIKAAEIDQAAVSTAVSTAFRIKNLITSLNDLDTTGLKTFTGIGTGGFGADGAAYKIAQAISAFSKEVSGIDPTAVTTSVTSARKLVSLINSLVGLDTSGIENFKPQSIGKAMQSYSNSVAGMDPVIVSVSISSANRLKNFIASLAGLDPSGISNFKVGSVGTALKSYASSVSGFNVGAVIASIAAATRLKNFIAGLASLNTSGVGSFKQAANELSTVNVQGIVKAFSGASTKLANAGSQMIDGLIKGMKSKTPAINTAVNGIITAINNSMKVKLPLFQVIGGMMILKMVSGMTGKKSTISSAIRTTMSASVNSIKNYYTNFYNSGSYLVDGFASGISANSYKAAAKARAMAEAAAKAAREALKINSPSKVFMAIASSIPEGFAMGIDNNIGYVTSSTDGMASTAAKGMTSAIARISSLMGGIEDSQPTIRPVMDLSDVNSGVAAINGMIGNGMSFGVSTNLSAVGSMMSRRNQNGTNNDVISAINSLKNSLDSGRSGDTFNINGVSYSADEEVANAIKVISRAATQARRA